MQGGKYIYQAKYGHAGGNHTARPMFVQKDSHIYKSEYHPEGADDKALYSVQGNKIYSTINHPQGAGIKAMYEIRGNKIHTTEHHPQHNAAQHVFEIGGNAGM